MFLRMHEDHIKDNAFTQPSMFSTLLVTGCCKQIPLTLLHNTPHRHYLETEEWDELFPESNLPCLSIHADDLPATRATKPVPYAKTSSYKMSQSYEAAKYGLRHMRSMRKFTGLPVVEGPVNFLQLQNILNVWCAFQGPVNFYSYTIL